MKTLPEWVSPVEGGALSPPETSRTCAVGHGPGADEAAPSGGGARFRAGLFVLLACVSLLTSSAQANASASWINERAQTGDFPLVSDGRAAPLVVSAEDFKVVAHAVRDLAADIERVTGQKPAAHTDVAGLTTPAVFIGTLGKSPAIDALVKAGKLDVGELRGKWETFLIATVAEPVPGLSRALVIVGSDRRGTAFGVYELAQAIGVSPWHWWADVAPAKKSALHVAAGVRRSGPPSVKYRGIFINDEDWALQPWAAKTFEPEAGGIGPKTYGKVFELLLRLKANTLWPAMHACTKPFNAFPENAALAEEYAIVMGASHAEPMLRNNVSEWTAAKETFNYATNREGVLKYWEERVASNGRYENLYTLGMRGIHDSGMQGGGTPEEQRGLLEKIFADQRALLAKHVRPEVEQVPQIFCAYKEVLGLFRGGLQVPDDVTVVFPDDNFGYIRSFAQPEERARKGGFGVYYHISYLGRPMAYLWLSTIPPALIWEEMNKAYEHGADRVWIVNVGDIKPAEIGTEFFLQMAWDIKRWRHDNLPEFLAEWAAREFGREPAREIADVMATYYRLNQQRKPEHLQWWLPVRAPGKAEPKPSALTPAEIDERLGTFARLVESVERIGTRLLPEQLDAFFELVAYPVRGSALANERYFLGERSALANAAGDKAAAREFAKKAEAADARLAEETRFFGEQVAGGKWRGFMSLEPADGDWSGMRIERWKVPEFPAMSDAGTAEKTPAANAATMSGLSATAGASGGYLSLEAEHFTKQRFHANAAWTVIPGLGRTGDAVAIQPTTMPAVAEGRISEDAPRLDYAIELIGAGEFTTELYLLPTHPLVPNGKLQLAIGLDEQPPVPVVLDVGDGGAEWAQGVLNGTRIVRTTLKVAAPGKHTLSVYGVEAGVVLDKIVIDCGGLTPSYLGPAATSVPAPVAPAAAK